MANVNQVGNTLNDVTGSGKFVGDTSATLVTPNLGTPSAGNLSSCTALPISTGVSGLGTGVATFLGTPSSANLATAVTDETGSGALVFGTSPTIATPRITTSINDSNGATSMAIAATASAVNYFTNTNAATAGSPTLAATGSDTNISAVLKGKGTGAAVLADSNGNAALAGVGVASAVNFIYATNAATGVDPSLSANGSDTNIALILYGKGTGGVGFQGIADGTNAAAGYNGEFISSYIPYASRVSLSTNTPANITSISLFALR